MLDFLTNITKHAKKQYGTAHGGGWGEGVTLAETATDEKQTSIVLNTKGLKETRTMSQQSIYKEIRITEKNQTNFGARKYVN